MKKLLLGIGGFSVLCVLSFVTLYVVLSWLALSLLPGALTGNQGVIQKSQIRGFPLKGYQDPEAYEAIVPVRGGWISAPFGVSPRYMGGTVFHTGVDFAVPVGTEVVTPMGGTVAYVDYDPGGYGNVVVIENGGVQMLFAHLSYALVAPGDRVSPGKVIGFSGNSGFSTGPHLHWEVRVNGQPKDPIAFMQGKK